MRIMLKCLNPSGSVACPAGLIDGLPVPERRYQIIDHQIILDGPAHIVHYDADELLAQGVLFRMVTPAEQNEQAQAQQAASTVAEQIAAPVEPAEQPPALSTSKKQSGG